MRRAHGPRSSITLETYELLAQLYTSTGLSYQAKSSTEKTGHLAKDYFRKALYAHEDILKFLTEDESDDDSDDEGTAFTLLAEHNASINGSVDGRFAEPLDESVTLVNKPVLAIRHLNLLKLAYQRYGGWPRQYSDFERLNANLFREFGSHESWKGAEGVEKWNAKDFGSGKAEKQDGHFEGVADWAFAPQAVHTNGTNGLTHQNGKAAVAQRKDDDDDEL